MHFKLISIVAVIGLKKRDETFRLSYFPESRYDS